VECPRCHRVNNEDSRFCASCGTSLPGVPPAGGTLTFFPDPEAFATGALFAGRYRIIEEIGHGGMGQVYKAYDTKVQEKIALKIIRPEIARSRTAVERFRNELKLARQITHPNVCRVFDLGEDAGTDFLTMEFVPGENLALMIRMTGPLALETAVGYARQMAKGLAAAHRLGVIHRDLKPHNILIDESGTAKIMDFGIARSLIAGTAADDGKMIGTPDYMAPEQAAGQPADARTDLYAFGAILYEMVTGRRPFEGDTSHEIVLKHRLESPRPPVELDGRIPLVLSLLILKCLAKDPDDRYQTADELLAALDELGPTISPAMEGRADRRRPRIRPRTALIGLAAAAAIFVAAALLFHKAPGGSESPQKPAFEAEASQRLAVMAFDDYSKPPSPIPYGDGLSSDIRTKLSATGLIKMIAQMSCEQLRGEKMGLRDKGLKLQARHILYGNYAVEGNVIRIDVFLGDAATDTEIWNGRYERPLDNFFMVRDQIASDVAERLRVPLSPERLMGIKKRDPVNFEAYKSYLIGQQYEKKYRLDINETDYLLSEQAYLQAVKLDPRYALVFCGLGYLAEAKYVKENPQGLALMHRRFQQAHDLDPDLAEAHLGLGLACLYENDAEQAVRFTRSALAADPDDAKVNYGVGAFLRSIGLYDLALAHFKKAAVLDRLNPSPGFNAAGCCWYLGRYDEAESLLRTVREIDSENYKNDLNLARQMLMKNNLEDAEREIARAEKSARASKTAAPSIRRHQAWLAAAKGDKDKALALLKGEPLRIRYEVTNTYCLLGLTMEALSLMESGYRTGFQEFKDYQYTYLYLERNRLMDPLRGHPRFKALLERARKDYDRWIRLWGGL